MSPRRRVLPPLIALLAAACAEEASTGVALSGLDEPLDLLLSFPHVSPEMFVTTDYVEVSAPEAQALVSEAELPPEDEYAYDPATAEAGIWNAYTDLTFYPAAVEAWGEHDYTGNKGRVEVTANVRHDGVVIGNRTGQAEEAHLWLIPRVHHIIANVLVHIDRSCGLNADAYSSHYAWWEITPGSGASVFDRAVVPTYSTNKAQPPCEPTPSTGGDGGGGGGGGLPEELTADYTCWMWFTYDEATLEVLDIQATWCNGGG